MCNAKLSIACKHVVKENAAAILALESEPIDPRESGRLYACSKCLHKVESGEFMKEPMENWMTICEDCVYGGYYK